MKLARTRYLVARTAVAEGQRPLSPKQKIKAGAAARTKAELQAAQNSFRAVAWKWYNAKAPHRSDSWRDLNRRYLERDLIKAMGDMPIEAVTVDDLREALNDVATASPKNVERARAGTLASDDLAGGAITVSNAGMFNVRFMTPIINPGHAMTLGVGSISGIFRPDEEGRPVLKDEMGLVLAADHRILDGVHGLEFLNSVVDYLENPMKLLSTPR